MRGLVLALTLVPLPLWGGEFFTLKGHGGPIMGIATMEDGRIVTASFDNSLGLWDGGAPRWFEGHEAAVNAVVANGTAKDVPDEAEYPPPAFACNELTPGAAISR